MKTTLITKETEIVAQAIIPLIQFKDLFEGNRTDLIEHIIKALDIPYPDGLDPDNNRGFRYQEMYKPLSQLRNTLTEDGRPKNFHTITTPIQRMGTLYIDIRQDDYIQIDLTKTIVKSIPKNHNVAKGQGRAEDC